MWSIHIRKCFAAILKAPKWRDQKGQTILEYLLILIVVVSLFMLIARPYIGTIGKKFQDLNKKGFFAEDTSGSNFYYYPLK